MRKLICGDNLDVLKSDAIDTARETLHKFCDLGLIV
jgi:hypothetical protein